jgi:DNA ligase-1
VVDLATLVTTSRHVASTRSRNDKAAALADFLRNLALDEIAFAVAVLSGYTPQGRIGVGYAAIRAASDAQRASLAAEQPDLFASAVDDHGPLTLRDLDRTLSELARASGRGVAAARTRLLRSLFARATAEEQQFLRHLLLGELRQGALSGVMEEAVARASGLSAERIRRAQMLAGDLGVVAVAALTQGEQGLEPFRLTLFRPVRPMLAQPAEDVAEAIDRLTTAAFEFKLDGARIQIHRDGARVAVYTRQLNDVTEAVPEVVDAVRALPLRDAVLDGEVIALRNDGKPHPFQVTMSRFGRRLDVEASRLALPLTTVLFDVLRRDGVDLFDRPERERRAALEACAAPLCVPRLVTADAEEARAFFAQALAAGHEGLMAKSLDAPYVAGGRGAAWLKVKPAHTLDLVVLAVERGSGRRSQWLSNLHLGARDPSTGGFAMLGKTFKGMTDEMLAWQTRALDALATRREGHIVWVRPELVVEIAFSDVQQSPRYPAGMALRLARVIRYRPDKRPAEADTIQTVREILEGQARKQIDARGLKGRPRR